MTETCFAVSVLLGDKQVEPGCGSHRSPAGAGFCFDAGVCSSPDTVGGEEATWTQARVPFIIPGSFLLQRGVTVRLGICDTRSLLKIYLNSRSSL